MGDLEATLICIDNSSFSRNGDYRPTRLNAQVDLVNLLSSAKLQAHPDSGVGLLTMGGERIQVLVTPTQEMGNILGVLSKVTFSGGPVDLVRGIQTAQLALKHRQNKQQRQRIIAVVGSKLSAGEKVLEQIGKSLKKNNVAIDVVSIGDVEENRAKLQKLIEAANSGDNSRYFEVEPSDRNLSDVVLSSGIVGTQAAGGGEDFGEFGVDPAADPELAMALRLSMEEERSRQQRMAADAAGEAGKEEAGAASSAAAPAATASGGAQPSSGQDIDPALRDALMSSLAAEGTGEEEDADEELRAALLASMQDMQGGPPPAEEDLEDDEDAALKRALMESMQDWGQGGRGGDDEKVTQSLAPTEPAQGSKVPQGPPGPSAAAPPPAHPRDSSDLSMFQDADFVADLLSSLPGVDIADPKIQEALKVVKDGDKKDEEKKDGDKK